MARGGTSRSGRWPSRASRSATWPAQTQRWPTRSSLPDRRATSPSGTACSGTALSWPPNRAPGMPPLPSSRTATRSTPAPQIDGYLSSVPSRAVRIRLMIHRGDIAGARRELARATGLRPLLTAAAPAGAVQLLLAFARAHLAIDDPAGARALVDQASEVIRDRPDLGVLPAEVDALRATLAARAPERGRGSTSLTVAELRVLALLPVLPLIQGDRAATRRQGNDRQVTGARDLPEAGRGHPKRRRRPSRRRWTPRALLAGRSVAATAKNVLRGLTTGEIECLPPTGRMFPPSGTAEIGVGRSEPVLVAAAPATAQAGGGRWDRRVRDLWACSASDRVGARSCVTVWTSDLDPHSETASVTTPERTG